MAGRFTLAIDQGTTSSRAILFDDELVPVATAQKTFRQIYPRPGLVEHDPEEIWETVVATMRGALAEAGVGPEEIAAIGITNQRETVVLWERMTGRAVANAIVWQDRRTAPLCERLRSEGHEAAVTRTTGLLLDPYFSATKIAWLLDNTPGLRARAEAGEILAGTIDSFLLWRLTGGAVHATDATNASRTLLCDIRSGRWSDEMCALFDVPMAMLPEIRDCAAPFGETGAEILGRPVPVTGIAGDQQAALVGQGCFAPGALKATFGTGAFILGTIGEEPVISRKRLLTTIGWQVAGRRHYALEGSIFMAGAIIGWLEDALGLIAGPEEAEELARKGDPGAGVMFVPAFTGLGAPWWDAGARGAILGLTRGAGRAEIVRAALESIALQTADLVAAMQEDGLAGAAVMRVDGGVARSDWVMQQVADLVGAPVDRPVVTETTARGAAALAMLGAGLLPSLEASAALWQRDRRFDPALDGAARAARLEAWHEAVRRVLSRPAGDG